MQNSIIAQKTQTQTYDVAIYVFFFFSSSLHYYMMRYSIGGQYGDKECLLLMCCCTGDNVFWFLFSRYSVVIEKLYRFKSPNITIYTSSVAIMRIHGCFDDFDPHMISLTTLRDILPWWSVPGLMYTKGCVGVCVRQYGREYRTNIDLYVQPRPVVC